MPVLLEPNKLTIKIINLNNISIQTPDGTTYLFGGGAGERTCYNYLSTRTTGPESDICSVSSWYIKQITTPLNQVINFEYKPASETEQISYSYSVITANTCQEIISNPPWVQGTIDKTYTRTKVNGNVISKITFPGGYVSFNSSKSRLDIINAYQIDSIKVFDKNSILIKSYALNYDYLLSQPDCTTCGFTDGALLTTTNDWTKRLRLLKITELAGDGSCKKPYQFSYNSTPLPAKSSYSQDSWGYFNGNVNSSILPTSPDEFIDTDNSKIRFSKGSREGNSVYGKAGILEKITYPTGGTTTFEFEGNTAGNSYYYIPELIAPTYIANDVNSNGSRTGNPTTTFTLTNSESAYYVKLIMSALCYGQDPTYPNCTPSTCLCESTTCYVKIKQGSTVLYSYNFDGNLSNENTIYKTVKLLPGTYTLEARIANGTNANAVIAASVYRKGKIKFEEVGGLRISKMSDYDGFDHAKDIVKVFEYGSKNSANEYTSSSGFLTMEPYYKYQSSSRYYKTTLNLNTGIVTREYLSCLVEHFSSNTALPLSGDLQGHQVGYYSVKVKHGDLGQNGFSLFEYLNGVTQRYMLRPGAPALPFALNGKLRKQTEYNLNGAVIKEITNVYETTTLQTINAMAIFRSEAIPRVSYEGEGRVTIEHHPSDIINSQTSDFLAYKLKQTWVKLIRTEERTYNGLIPAMKIKEFEYELNPVHFQVKAARETQSNGDTFITEYTFPADYTDADGDNVINDMKNAKHMHSSIVSQTRKFTSGLETKILSRQATTYFKSTQNFILPQSMVALKASAPILENQLPLFRPASTLDLSTYEPKIYYDYDIVGNLISVNKANDSKTSYIWDYTNTLPIAEVKNAIKTDIAHTSFEADGLGNWEGIILTSTSTLDKLTGLKSYDLSATAIATKSGLNLSQTYVLSFWAKSGIVPTVSDGPATPGQVKGGWTYYEKVFSGKPSVTISGSGTIDELRLYPKDAQMTTYTYSPGIGMTSNTDANNVTTYYEYDLFNRLQILKDDQGNVLKKYEYTYQVR